MTKEVTDRSFIKSDFLCQQILQKGGIESQYSIRDEEMAHFMSF